MSVWSNLLSFLPFEWSQHQFMNQALLAVILITPIFGLMGTMVVNNRMAFFSDSLGHSALAGIALGVIIGLRDPLISMLAFGLLMALALSFLKRTSNVSTDTIIGVLSSSAMALGIVILSRGGGFAKYSRYLIGDILSITSEGIIALALVFGLALVYWYFMFNKLLLVSINPVMARSRGVKVLLTESLFMALVAVLVTISIQWVGILIINALLILPAAAARNLARNMRVYHLLSVIISLVAGVVGLLISYYWGTAAGATIVLCNTVFFLISWLINLSNYSYKVG
ncbi:MAG: metal ABC transporter permease [Peptococcaceae bacterium]|nr:metal ABC transporter permease [Peptococcaceae bacterium]